MGKGYVVILMFVLVGCNPMDFIPTFVQINTAVDEVNNTMGQDNNDTQENIAQEGATISTQRVLPKGTNFTLIAVLMFLVFIGVLYMYWKYRQGFKQVVNGIKEFGGSKELRAKLKEHQDVSVQRLVKKFKG